MKNGILKLIGQGIKDGVIGSDTDNVNDKETGSGQVNAVRSTVRKIFASVSVLGIIALGGGIYLMATGKITFDQLLKVIEAVL